MNPQDEPKETTMRSDTEVHDDDTAPRGTGRPAAGAVTGRVPPARRSGVAVVDRETGAARRRRPDRVTRDGATGEDARVGDGGVGDGATAEGPPTVTLAHDRRRSGRRWGRAVPWGLAVAGLVGTLVFGHAWAHQNSVAGQQAQVRNVSADFLLALTNFDAKDVDADFSRIQGYATGDFAKQSNQFFGSTIRTQLEAALASSRGQLRSQYVQSLGNGQASVYSVVDQTYVNNKMQSPAADELQIVTDLTQVGGAWKVGDVTVLDNASGATGTSSGTSGATAGTSTPSTTAGG
jgi:hypothetical protein